MPAPVEATSWVSTWAQFVKAHETILIIALAAFLLFKSGQGIENAWIRHDEKNSQTAAAVVVTDTTSNKALTDQLNQVKSDAALQTAQLNLQITTASQQLKQQQGRDAAASQQAIADRWNQLLPLPTGSVTAPLSGPDQVTPDAANKTVQALEQIPVLQQQIVALDQELLTDNKVISDQNNLIIGLNVQIVDEKASHVADVKTATAKGHASFWKGFKIGFVAGTVAVEAVRVWAGHP